MLQAKLQLSLKYICEFELIFMCIIIELARMSNIYQADF